MCMQGVINRACYCNFLEILDQPCIKMVLIDTRINQCLNVSVNTILQVLSSKVLQNY